MILIIAILLALTMICAGTVVAWPWWFTKFTQRRLWCEICHQEITVKKKFIASFGAGESLEGRQA